MSRSLAHRCIVDAWLVASSPVHVGGMGGEGDVDLAVARDGLGRLVVPGTSIAGAWRSVMRNQVPPSDAERGDVDEVLWGPLDPGPERGRGSLMSVEDALVVAPGRGGTLPADVDVPGHRPAQPALDVRDHVGIDRRTGAASPDVLYSRASLPAGTLLRLRVEVDIPADDMADELIGRFHQALAVLRYGFNLGSGSNHGLGRVELAEGAKLASIDVRPGGASALKALLQPEFEDLVARIGELDDPRSAQTATASIHWKPLTPTLVQASLEGDDADIHPLADEHEGKVRLVIPGSSIRGALRSHAEMIVRTVLGHDTVAERLIDQLEPDGVVTALFGGNPPQKDDGGGAIGSRGSTSDEDTDTRDAITADSPAWIGRGALKVHDVFGTTTIPWEHWAEVTGEPLGDVDEKRGKKALSEDARKAIKLGGLRQRHHVAIDRWTGGASKSALFSVLVPEPSRDSRSVDWSPIELEVDLARLERTGLADEALALFWLVLRDLHAGRIAIGSGATRGRGSITVDDPLVVEMPGGPTEIPHQSWIDAWRTWAESGGAPLVGAEADATEER